MAEGRELLRLPVIPLRAIAGRRPVRRLVVSWTILCVAWLAISSLVAYKLTHRLGARAEEVAPRPAWGRLQTHRLATRDGQEVGAWFVDGRGDAPSVLVLHGHKGRRWNSLGRAELLAAQGYAVLMLTLRAHGDSTGEFDDVGFGARNDVIAGVELLEARRPGRPVIVDGNSMGAAAAIFAARELGHRVRGYILESAYRDLRTAVWNRVEEALPPVLDLAAYAGLNVVAPVFLPHLDEISPLRAIAGIPEDVPVLILAGDSDRMARPDEARALHRQVASHGRLVFFPGAGHGDLFHDDPDLYTRSVLEFCREVAGARAGAPPDRAASVGERSDPRGSGGSAWAPG
jgi:alpha-beta hydrolase superfamily lysophospholipase